MTRLNKMVLRGFKSFKRKTVLPFKGNGLTAIVGENGSGKSNLVDALTFVMGQRSSKLRAERLEQLIYNGGEEGTQADHARVTLHLDNSRGEFDGVLQDFLNNGKSPDEITIGRKITESSSSYRCMDKNCKRSLIDSILDQANIDPGKPHVVNQGKVTEIINMRPKERRKIIDDLAGIDKYEQRKEEAISDLREVKEKIMTNRVILGERRGQLNRLKEEREAALDYKEKQAELNSIENSIIARKRKAKEAELETFQSKHEKAQNNVQGLKSKLDDLDRETEELDNELEGLRQKRDQGEESDLKDRAEELRMEIVKKRGNLSSKENEIENLKESIDELENLLAKRQSSGGKSKSRSVKARLERGHGGIYGTVEDLMDVEGKYEVAIETAAGGHLHDLVVDSRSTAIEAVNYLKENNLGRARLLPLMRLSGSRRSPASKKARSLDGVIDYAIELVEFKSKYRRAFEYVFRDTLVAKDLESVEKAENVRVVTLDGDVLSRGGAITGGSSKKKSRKSNKGQEVREKIKEKKKRVKRLEKELREGRDELSALSDRLDRQEQKIADQSEEDEELKEEIQSVERKLNSLKKEKREVYRELERSREKSNEFEKKLDGIKYQLENLEEPEEDFELIDEPVKDLIDKKRAVQRELDRLRPVNMKSIEEYEKFKAEVEDLEEKLELLKEEKRDVERLIGDIEQRKRDKFYSTMEDLSSEFQEIFKGLFEGGQAHLQLEREGDIESGLLIKAHPPGKELHVLDSLSGGEKSLTAIAFIFGLQELNPSPFYVMDEIDAALDLRRSRKLANLLESYAQESQLILISHNEETAKHADRVYGVTMNDSQSEILSLELV